MKTISPLKASIFKVFFILAIVLCISSCKRINPIENTLKSQSFAKNEREEIEVDFFITVANVSKGIISKSQIAQQKSSDVVVKQLSQRIEFKENQLLDEITRLSTLKLIVINEINTMHKRDLYNLADAKGDEFDEIYLNATKEALKDQIELFESISRETNDKKILELVLRYLPEQYKLLRETERITKQNV
ncbi:putative outer membrane protein [Flavobacterium nitrogenifigens]|uniref:Outer membrane protein n=2 Tax=Flavobacterium TaxID=237 RepID=A0ABR6QFX0_9FLAO|nr:MULTISPECIES: DUF4142 domain-containing protein [Flavobacterium]MBB4803088.1 putative outer membrane protein [Flavobacterium nitrogenifigens]MBB6388046.1 putative outer membrane protein [Flavobacterium notoginsengisoli]